jgi:glycerol-3-phosphate acyltransferase PlsY
MHEPWAYALWVLGAFLLGSASVGDLVSRIAGVRIRTLGTGNPGAANIYREIGPAYGIAVIVLDIVKGAAATLPLYFLDFATWMRIVAMVALLFGHLLPVFWRFRGGTGMATTMGSAVGLLPVGGLAALPTALLAVSLSKNPGYSGGLFFLVTLVVGGVAHRDGVGVAGVALAAAAIFIKARHQYRDE